MAIVFPASPTVGEVYPPGAGVAGVSQWTWDGTKWNTVPVFVRTNNQSAFNDYVWPLTKSGTPGYQLTDFAADADLSWDVPGGPFVYLDDISSQFDGATNNFTLTIGGNPVNLADPENVIIVLGGIVQTPGPSFTISSPVITFSLPPAAGASFCGISNAACIP